MTGSDLRALSLLCFLILLTESCNAFVVTSSTPMFLSRAGSWSRHHVSRRSAPCALTSLSAVSSEVSQVLSKFGVPADQHEALMKELSPLMTKQPSVQSSKLDIEVVRGEKGLGIDVDQDNVIQGNAGQPSLNVGDQVVAVDGEQLAGRPIAEVLTPGKSSYAFTVLRGVESAQSLEDKISLLAADEEMFAGANGLSGQDPTKSVQQFLQAAESLEQLCTGIEEAQLKGFWKLAYTNDLTFVAGGGASGLAAMPYCSLAAHWQCFQDKEPKAQTVEVVANANLGAHSIAALKGGWTLGAAQETEAGLRSAVTESYKRLEYGGSVQGGAGVQREVGVTYAGKTVRICRKPAAQVVGAEGEVAAGESVYVYLRKPAEEVQGQLQQWMEKDVPGAAPGSRAPKWETAPGEGGGAQSMLRD